MSDNVLEFKKNELPPLLIGPFEEYRVIVDGRIVPNLTAFKEGDDIALVVDHRFSSTFSPDRARDVAYLIAQASAVASGYSHFCADSKDHPFARIACQIDPLPKL